MKSVHAQFEIVTPMFLGGADHAATRIRETSIKGALAFWWRALNYAQFAAKETAEKDALATLQKREQQLFGGGDSGQGCFLLKVENSPHIEDVLPSGWGKVLGNHGDLIRELPLNGNSHELPDTVGPGARYLGYGLMEAFSSRKDSEGSWDRANIKKFAGELHRSCFRMGKQFSIRLVFRPTATCDNIKEIIQALKLFGLLGGLGSRVRRGWGSVALESLEFTGIDGVEKWSSLMTVEDYKDRLKKVIGSELPTRSGMDFRLTAFAQETDIRIGKMSQTGTSGALDVLNKTGEGLLRYRSRGRPTGKYGNVNVDASFIDDHDWFKELNRFSEANGGRKNYVPLRTAFGLPHNYSQEFGVTASDNFDRRASPLFFHIQKYGDEFTPITYLMPTKFLPMNQVDISHNKNREPIAYVLDKSIIKNFLDGIAHSDSGEITSASPPYFPSEKLFQ